MHKTVDQAIIDQDRAIKKLEQEVRRLRVRVDSIVASEDAERRRHASWYIDIEERLAGLARTVSRNCADLGDLGAPRYGYRDAGHARDALGYADSNTDLTHITPWITGNLGGNVEPGEQGDRGQYIGDQNGGSNLDEHVMPKGELLDEYKREVARATAEAVVGETYERRMAQIAAELADGEPVGPQCQITGPDDEGTPGPSGIPAATDKTDQMLMLADAAFLEDVCRSWIDGGDRLRIEEISTRLECLAAGVRYSEVST